MKIRYGMVLLLMISAVEARSVLGALKDARKRVSKALDKASSLSFNDLIGRHTSKTMALTPELLRGLGSPAAYEHLQKAELLFGSLFWAEQYDLVAALNLVTKAQAQESRSMLRSMLKKAMADHSKNLNPSTLDFAKELVAEEATLAQVLNELLKAADGLKNSASMLAAEHDVKGLHDRRNKDLATLKSLGNVVADLLAM